MFKLHEKRQFSIFFTKGIISVAAASLDLEVRLSCIENIISWCYIFHFPYFSSKARETEFINRQEINKLKFSTELKLVDWTTQVQKYEVKY